PRGRPGRGGRSESPPARLRRLRRAVPRSRWSRGTSGSARGWRPHRRRPGRLASAQTPPSTLESLAYCHPSAGVGKRNARAWPANRNPSGDGDAGLWLGGGGRPGGGQRVLEVAVGLHKVAPRLEDRGVRLVDLGQTRSGTGGFGGGQGGLEFAVRVRVEARAGCDSPQQRVGLRGS